MSDKFLTGKIHSFQSLGTVDGPGIRFVVFTQGCPLRCGCCHNPDTWDTQGGTTYTSEQVLEKAIRYKEYFGKDGGVTVSGGEPLLQPEFVNEFFTLCRKNGINTCLDTSGCILNQSVKNLLTVTDRVLLDIKYTTEELYQRHVGCSFNKVIDFLDYLEKLDIPTTIRQVIIPTINDDEQSVLSLKSLVDKYKNVDGVELLPFRKICQSKYDALNMQFKFADILEPSESAMQKLNSLIKQ